MAIAETVKQIIKEDAELSTITLSTCGLGTDDIQELISLLAQAKSKKITAINLDNNNLTDIAIQIFVEDLPQQIELASLSLSSNYIHSIGCKALMRLANLKELDVSQNALSNNDASELMTALSNTWLVLGGPGELFNSNIKDKISQHNKRQKPFTFNTRAGNLFTGSEQLRCQQEQGTLQKPKSSKLSIIQA